MTTIDRIRKHWGLDSPKRGMIQASKTGANTQTLFGAYRNIDSEIRFDMKLIRARCREIGSGPVIQAFKNALLNNVLGPSGIHFQMKIKTSSLYGDRTDGEPDKRANDIIETAYKTATRRENYLVNGSMSKRAADEVKLLALVDDGEIFIRTHQSFGQSESGLARQLIGADVCDIEYNEAWIEGGGQIRMGIEFDKWGRRVAYHFLTKDPGDYLQDARRMDYRERVPARFVRHLFIPLKPGQSRGVPMSAQAVLSIRQLEAFVDASVVNARIGAARNVYYTKQYPQGWTPGDGQLDDNGAIVDDLREGESLELPWGVEAKMLDTRFPDAAIEPFTKSAMRFNAMALGTSYMTLSNDLSEANFSSLRAGLNEERSTWARLQQFFIECDCEPDFHEFLTWGLATQFIKLPESKIKKFNVPKFTGRRWSSVNPLQDAAADVTNINNLLMSRSEVIEMRGADPEEVLAQIAEDRANAEALGLTAEKDPSLAAEVLKQSIEKPE